LQRSDEDSRGLCVQGSRHPFGHVQEAR